MVSDLDSAFIVHRVSSGVVAVRSSLRAYPACFAVPGYPASAPANANRVCGTPEHESEAAVIGAEHAPSRPKAHIETRPRPFVRASLASCAASRRTASPSGSRPLGNTGSVKLTRSLWWARCRAAIAASRRAVAGRSAIVAPSMSKSRRAGS